MTARKRGDYVMAKSTNVGEKGKTSTVNSASNRNTQMHNSTGKVHSSPQTATKPVANASMQSINKQQSSRLQTGASPIVSHNGQSAMQNTQSVKTNSSQINASSTPMQTTQTASPTPTRTMQTASPTPTRPVQTASPTPTRTMQTVSSPQTTGSTNQNQVSKATKSTTSQGYHIAQKVATMTSQTLVLSSVTNSSASTKNTLNSYKNKKVNNNEYLNAAKAMIGKIENATNRYDDLGMKTVAGSIAGARISSQVFKASQTVVKHAPMITQAGVEGVSVAAKGINVGAKGVYQVGLQTGKTTVAIVQAYGIAKGLQVMPISKTGLDLFRQTAIANGLNNTQISKAVIHTATSVQTGLVHAVGAVKSVVPNTIMLGKQVKNNVVTAATATATTAKMMYSTVRGVATGALSFSYVAYNMEMFAKLQLGKGILKATPYVKAGLGTALRGTAIGAKWSLTKGIPKGLKGARGVLTAAAGLFGGSDDYVVQGVVKTIQGVDRASRLGTASIKTGYTLGKKVTTTTIKTGVSVAKGISFWHSYVKANGVRRMFEEAGKRAGKGAVTAAIKGSKSIVSAAMNLVKMMGRKIIIPILLIVFVACGGLSVISAPIMAIGSIFSGIFGTSDTEEEFEVQAFLANASYGVPSLTVVTKQDIADDMRDDWKTYGGSYDVVRLMNPNGTGEVVAPTLDGVSTVFYTDAEVIQILENIFNAKILMDYDLEPTLQEAKDVLNDMYSKIFTVTTVQTTEYCGQSLADGTGTARAPHDCGYIHAITSGENTCPNQSTGTHSSWVCGDCCSYYCPGHHHSSGSHAEGTYHSWTDYCGGCVHQCSGYAYCNGHNVNSYVISLDGLYPLINETFLQPIEDLSNIANRTDEEEEKLQNLKDYYEIFQIMMSESDLANGSYGGSLTADDLRGVQWATSGRTGNNDVVNLAIAQATSSSVGGAIYWSYYGFSSRVEWCACFVHWCMRHTESATGAYPNTENNAYCQTLANYFSGAGQFKNSSEYGNLAPGDVIFFDWQSDGHTDHVGIVIGRDDDYVYTVEGNSGDAVKIKKYSLTSSSIYGYAFLNY